MVRVEKWEIHENGVTKTALIEVGECEVVPCSYELMRDLLTNRGFQLVGMEARSS